MDGWLPFAHKVFVNLRVERNGPRSKVEPAYNNTYDKHFFIVNDGHSYISILRPKNLKI